VAPTVAESGPLPAAEVQTLDAYWRAANYLSVGQIYLMANPLLAEPLRAGHIKPRLLGHWGTSPGLNFVWAHLSRAITAHGTEMMIVIGPGHGGPAALANTWLEGSYSEVYPSVPRNAAGMATLFRQFSFPGGVPSHVAPETPGSIHEGGELGYSLSHACGAAFDNPGLVVACVVGDGEAETGPMATSWHGCRFLDPARDGAVLPILHLNGYKIANPALLARLPDDELDALLRGYGYQPKHVTGHERLARRQYALIGVIQRLLGANGVKTDLETALFDVDHGIRLERTLALARLARRERPSIDGDDVLAWALARTGHCGEALRFSERALRLGTRDAPKDFHRGMIERCLGHDVQARLWLRRALGLNPHFSLLWAPLARRYAS